MLRVYARTREREAAWKLGAYCLGGALILAPIVNLIFRKKDEDDPIQVHGPIQVSLTLYPKSWEKS
jgi:hypothetical protein